MLKESLVRWVLQQQRRTGDSRAPAAHDEATHAPSKTARVAGPRAWQEEYVFAAVQEGLGVVVRLEWMPGRDAHRVWVVLVREHDAFTLPGGQALAHHRADADRWRACGLEIDCLAPYERWSVQFAGRLVNRQVERSGEEARCAIELEFVADAPPFVPGTDDDPELIARRLAEATWDRDLLRSIREMRTRGYVQLGAMNGTIALGDELVPVRASAIRHHSWGERDWGASSRAMQCFVALDPALDPAEGGTRVWIHRAQFPELVLEGGFVRRAGRTIPVSAIATTETERSGRAPSRVGISVDGGGVPLVLEGEMLGDATFAVDGRGAMEIGLLRLAQGGVGLWAGQRSLTLPVRASR